MPISELVDYVRTQTQEGVTAEDLRVALMEAGWQEFDVDNALHDVAAGLSPTTPGASIHEDLAQVRGMVAHLATRLKGVEARLASISELPTQQSLPAQAQLPSGYVGTDHQLADRPHKSVFVRILSTVVAAGLAVGTGIYVTDVVRRSDVAPMSHLLFAGGLGALLLLCAVVVMRKGRGWAASMLSAGGLTLLATDIVVAWRVYHYMEWTVVLALGILFVVIAVVMGRWIQRLAR